jgi:hydroxymethylbilane synthase
MPRGPQIRLGTRASALARWQAEWVRARLEERGVDVVLVPITTGGDREQAPIRAGSDRGVFTREIQQALLDGRVDLAVHSLKDLPTEQIEGLALAAVPPRASVADVLVGARGGSLEELPDRAIVGTGSLRRRAQIGHIRPDLQMRDLRGNVDTRLRKLASGDYDAIVLAEAGLRRLGLDVHITHVLPLATVLPAPGQGALGLEIRLDDDRARRAIEALDDPLAHAAVVAERAMLTALQGGCLAPIAAWGRFEGDRLVLTGRVLSPDGAEKVDATATGTRDQAAALGRRLATELIGQGAAELIARSRA